MKIQYDHQIFTSQKYGGISRYFYELIKEFELLENVQTNTPLLLSNNHYISEKKYTNHIDFLPLKQFRGKQRLMNLFNKPNSMYTLKKQNFDIFHPTYYDPYFLDYIGNKPFVLTVYDMIHEKFSDMFSPFGKTSTQKKLLVEKATKVIAISESTKKDLIELFGTDESKIEVVYLGNSMFPNNSKDKSIDIPEKYMLFVGSRGAYKNFERFISSISQTLKDDKNLFLICAGGGKFNTQEIESFSNLSIINQIKQYNLDDDTLANLYKNAELFVFPSLYEGFGIPILEAFACECPLVCSETSSLPEVAGDAACYFDPYSQESIREAVEKVLQSNELQNKLRQKGTKRLEQFSWKQTALDTRKIYESILR
jgi:glycosyltransferase involved in cell wall biosynthesis